MSDDPLRRLGDRQRDVESNPDAETAERLEALLPPIEGDERSDLLDGAFARLSDSSPSEGDEEDDEGSAPQVVSLGEARQRRSVWIAAAIAVAAALLLWLGMRQGTTPAGDPLALPSYSAARLEGGARTMRSGDDASVTKLELGADDRVEWVFKPETPVTKPLAATVLAVSPAAEPVLSPVVGATVSPRGVVTVEGPLSEIVPLSPGTWQTTVLIGSPDTVPTAADEAAAAGPWARVAFELNVVAP